MLVDERVIVKHYDNLTKLLLRETCFSSVAVAVVTILQRCSQPELKKVTN